jgi:crotonobetainyl-CoA:carnitine CoA-transferase CaiB-like acyl-CoA transferase
MFAIAAIEQEFWNRLRAAIEAEFHADESAPVATCKRVSEILDSRPAKKWVAVFEAADCCCSVVRCYDEAQADPHFRARGLIDTRVARADGQEMVALPAPICVEFKCQHPTTPSAPRLGEHLQPEDEERSRSNRNGPPQ